LIWISFKELTQPFSHDASIDALIGVKYINQ